MREFSYRYMVNRKDRLWFCDYRDKEFVRNKLVREDDTSKHTTSLTVMITSPKICKQLAV